MKVLRFYCNYTGDTFCYSYVSRSFSCNYAVRSVCSTYAGDSFCSELWVILFIVIMQVGVSFAITQVVFSAVHYAHDCFYCNYADDR